MITAVRGLAARLRRRFGGEPYDEAFFAAQREGSARSAAVVVPFVVELVGPRSVVDVGCGTGAWLEAFGRHGVEDLLGIDGESIPRAVLAIPPERFMAHDVARPIALDRTFDLVVSLEVAEHLPSAAAADFVESLTRLGPVVLFSAAIPGQLGEHHVNEQWQDYWAELFEGRGYVPVDCLRRRIWSDPEVQWWYAQNMLLYVERSELEGRPRLRTELELMGTGQLAVAHPSYVEWREHVRSRLRRAYRRITNP